MEKQQSANEFDKKYDILDIPTPPKTLMCGRYKRSFAYYTLRERLPVILTTIIDGLNRDKDDLASIYSEESREEVKGVVGQISKLKYELQTDKKLELLTGSESDQIVWNKFLNELPSDQNTFFKACWLYAECYMYRRVYSFFYETKYLKTYDYFEKQKNNALIVSLEVMRAVAQCTRNIEKSGEMFRKLLKINLWGNRCDLSITTGKEVKPTEGNPFQLIESFENNLLIDETQKIWECLRRVNEQNEGPIVIDIICDNSGYELFTDLIIAEYIIDKNIASKVRFFVKAIPWYISDVMPKDFYWTIKYLSEHDDPLLNGLGKKWQLLADQGKFELVQGIYYWTGPFEFYRMADVDDNLYENLARSNLLIFKGDLNYRKLIGDFTWSSTDDFRTCLREFQPTNLCTLRTVKADLICGLPAGRAEELDKQQADWMLTGEYGVIQFSESLCHCPK